MNDPAAAARQMWALLEPVHAVTYFTPEARAAFEQAGLPGWPAGAGWIVAAPPRPRASPRT